MKAKHYLVSFVLFLAMVMIGGCGGVSHKPSAGDWNRYKNETYGYSLCIPQTVFSDRCLWIAKASPLNKDVLSVCAFWMPQILTMFLCKPF